MRKGGVIAIIIIAVLVIAAVVGFIVYNNSQSSGTESGVSTDGPDTRQTGSGLGFESDQTGIVKQNTGGISIPGWDKITIDAGQSDVYVDFYNPESNEGKYYLTYEVLLDGETLYKSGLIKAGDHVKKITLSRPLEAGTYDVTIHVQPYTADDSLIATNNMDLKVKLIAE